MNRSYNPDDDRELPWDPMWAYVLGEDIDDRDNREDISRETTDTVARREESRDTSDASSGGTILKKLWNRRERDAPPSTIPSHSRSVDREVWSWEIDTSQFNLMSNESDRTSSTTSDRKKWISTSTKKIRDSIGTAWKESQPSNSQNRSILSRKSS